METKGKSELVFSQNNCVSERGFVVPVKSVYNTGKFYFIWQNQHYVLSVVCFFSINIDLRVSYLK